MGHSIPFLADRYDLGQLGDGRPLTLAAMTTASAQISATAAAASGPWAHYGYTPAQLTARLSPAPDGVARLEVRVGGDNAGCLLIRPNWLAGPYLQMIAVGAAFAGQGIGTTLLAWYERESQAAGPVRNVWLCVSGFNTGAQRLYHRHGYELAARLDDLMRPGDDELLMRKRIVR